MQSKDGTTTLRAFKFRIGGNPQAVHVVRDVPWGKWVALGRQFGPTLFVKCEHENEALDIFDEHFGERFDWDEFAKIASDWEPTDHNLREASANESDPAKAKLLAAYFQAMDCGDIRMNDGGTVVWVDHYEWMSEIEYSAARRRTCRWRR